MLKAHHQIHLSGSDQSAYDQSESAFGPNPNDQSGSRGGPLTLPKTNMEAESTLFVEEDGLPRGHSPLPC